jgi:hypothetical protein
VEVESICEEYGFQRSHVRNQSAGGRFGGRMAFACASTNWCSNPFWDDPLVEGDEGLFD